MSRRLYSSRNSTKKISVDELYWKIQNLYLLFSKKDYFKGKAGIASDYFPDSFKYEAAVALPFQPFPITNWSDIDITEDNIFDVLEFLFDFVSKPGAMVTQTTESGFDYQDYDNYDDEAGREEFRNTVNVFLIDYKDGYELTKDGVILSVGVDGLQFILNAKILPYDEVNVDSKVRSAISKWRNRNLSLSDKKEAIRELADVFEWLKKAGKLEDVLDKKDESTLFNIANNFSIRHHEPEQKANYDTAIWYAWMFHFYMATYHAVVRLLIKVEKDKKQVSENSI